jgi:hypothetical protein
MGVEWFVEEAEGRNAAEAFHRAVQDAITREGNGGYTGTLAEKGEFVMFTLPAGKDPDDYVRQLHEYGDPRIDDKWGPAGVLRIKPGHYLIFGFASS